MTELKLYCTIATQSVVEILIPRFEAAHGTKIAAAWGTAPQLVKRLLGKRRFVLDSHDVYVTDLGRLCLGLRVRGGCGPCENYNCTAA